MGHEQLSEDIRRALELLWVMRRKEYSMTETISVSPSAWDTCFDQSVPAKWLWEKEGLPSKGSQRPSSQHRSLPVARPVDRMGQVSGYSSGQPSFSSNQLSFTSCLPRASSCLVHCHWRKGPCLSFQPLPSKGLHSYLGQQLKSNSDTQGLEM